MPIYKMDGKKDGLQKYRVRVSYTDREGKYRQVERTVYGRDAARETEQQLTREYAEQKNGITRLTVSELAAEYITSKQYELRETSVDKLKKIIDLYAIPYIGTIRIDKLTAPVVRKWKTAIEEIRTTADEPLALRTKQNIYTTISAMFNYAVRMEYIPKNPLSIVGNFKDAYTTKQKIDYYTADEFLLFIAAAREYAEQTTANLNGWDFYTFFNIAFYTGMRKGEINALRWTDIDGDTIHITRSITQKLKGEDRETPPKNKASIRDIQIPDPLRAVLCEHHSRYTQVDGFTDDWHICGGIRCLRDTTIEKHNTEFAEKAGIKKIRIHDFRHSHASLLANNAINIQEIARRLGHSKVDVTWNTYSHLYPREEERAITVLNTVSDTSPKSLKNP